MIRRSPANSMVAMTMLALAGAVAFMAFAGPLDPPPGPVAPTYKTLAEVEPRIAINTANTPGDVNSLFKLTQRGSYYLTGNITGVAGKHGVEIAASGVTLDLNGFDLAGVPGMGAFDGISTTATDLTDIAVVNGSVRNWGGNGVNLRLGAVNCRVTEIRASGNTATGIAADAGGAIANCSAFNNSQGGISAGDGCAVLSCVAYSNVSDGIAVGEASSIADCSGYLNGRHGIVLGAGCAAANCSAFRNEGNGVNTTFDCAINNCSTTANTLSGFVASSGATFTGCLATGNFLYGFQTFDRATLAGCSAASNRLNGIDTTSGCTIQGCTVKGNGVHGIECNAECTLRENTCSMNGFVLTSDGAGIHATGSDNHIEGNHCTGADRGILVDGAGNVIIKNTCASNTIDWIIAVNNIYGAVVDRRAPASVFVNGFAAPSTMGSTDPYANFSH